MGESLPQARLADICAADPFLRERAVGGPAALRAWLLDERDALEAGRVTVIDGEVLSRATAEMDRCPNSEPDWPRLAMATRMLAEARAARA